MITDAVLHQLGLGVLAVLLVPVLATLLAATVRWWLDAWAGHEQDDHDNDR